MAGIEFDRQVFAPVAEAKRTQAPKAMGAIFLVLALGLAGFVGYKIFTQASQANAIASANAQVETLQAQLADSQKRIDELQKHHKAVKPEPPVPVVQAPVAEKKSAPKPKPVYHVAAASALPAQPKPVVYTAPPAAIAVASQNTAAIQSELNANHEAWQATTDRLADVVGVVGQQQNELSETREAVNQLLSQSRRQALPFELMRGNNRMPVGPVTLQLKSVDLKGQRYSVCVYFEDRCIELKDRVLNEVVVFVVSKNSSPLELVATKVVRDQIVGYLEVPADKQQ
jgi:septal ring factor EnvC (AmiA/AmiB activator)